MRSGGLGRIVEPGPRVPTPLLTRHQLAIAESQSDARIGHRCLPRREWATGGTAHSSQRAGRLRARADARFLQKEQEARGGPVVGSRERKSTKRMNL